MSSWPIRLILAACVTGTAATSAAAEQLFADGFEECGFGRWSDGTFVALPMQLDGLTPAVLAEALGACAPSLTSAQYVLADGSTPGATALADMSNFQSAVQQAFGTGGIVPTAGGAMIALGSGRARSAGQPGFIAPEPGAQYGHESPGPPQFMAAHGNAFPGVPGCPDGPDLTRDSVGLRLTFQVPADAAWLRFDWRWLTADYPEWLCTTFIDYGLGIVVTGSSPALPADRDVMLDSTGWPLSSNTPDLVYCTGCPGGDGPLALTGYQDGAGAGTEWRTASVPVVAGETLVLDLLAFDVSDRQSDNLLLLDGLRWAAD